MKKLYEEINEVLEFYANKENHKNTLICGSEIISEIDFDGGDKSQKLLSKIKEKENKKLYSKRCVLSGPIDRVSDDGIVWRKYIKDKCAEKNIDILFFDPCDKPKGLGCEIGVEKTKVRELINQNKWAESREFVKKFRHYDLRAVDWSDFMIIKIDIKSHLCGSYDEMFMAERELKPIFVIMGEGQTKYDIPTWLLSFINEEEIFDNEDDCIAYLEKINDGKIDLDERWVDLG